MAIGLGVALSGGGLRVRAASTPAISSVRVYGLPTHGRFQLLQDGKGTGIWVFGAGRHLWKLHHTRSSGGWQAVQKLVVPSGRLIPWTHGRMALAGAHDIRWISPRGRILPRSVPLPHRGQWVFGAGIQVRVGRRVYEWAAGQGWKPVALIPPVAHGRLWAVGVTDPDPWAPGPDVPTAPIYALWRKGPRVILETHTPSNGWREHRLPLGRSLATVPPAVANTTLVIAKRPLTTLTIAPTDALAAETVYPGQESGQLDQNSTVLTTVRQGEIAAWMPALFMGRANPVVTLAGTAVLGQADDALLYRPTPDTAALATFSPPVFPPFDATPSFGPRWKTVVVRREPTNVTAYEVGRRWMAYDNGGLRQGHASLTVGGLRYTVSPGSVVADPSRLWLLTPESIWEVGPTGQPKRIAWPAGLPTNLGPKWLENLRVLEQGSTLYAAVGVEIPGSVSRSSQDRPMVRPMVVRVKGQHAAVLSRYPEREGAVTSLALGPGNRLYLALYTGPYSINFGFEGSGHARIVAYNQTTRQWHEVSMPRSAYHQISDGPSLVGEAIMNLTVLPGPRYYFLVQSNPNGTQGGMGANVWELRQRRLRFYNIAGDSPSIPYGLDLTPAATGVLVNGGNVLGLIRPRQGFGYVGSVVPTPTEWLKGILIENAYQGGVAVVKEIRIPELAPRYLTVNRVAWSGRR